MFLAMVVATLEQSDSAVPNIPVVREFEDVFPKEVPDLSSVREVP